MSSPQVEEIKARIDAVAFIEGYVRLAKAGINFKARCPFHNERTPSFMVSASRQTWHCFGCGKGGDIFTFLMEMEGMEFPEALRVLAERAGVALTRETPQAHSERTHLLALLEAATRFYEVQLREHPEVGEYLKGRGLTGQTAKHFRVGFAPDQWDGLLNYLAGKGYRMQEAEKVGLAIGSHDRFRNRIMFPLADSAGRIVGFTGRIFGTEPEGVGKYINTPQTIFYDKSKLLYAFDKAKHAIRRQNVCVLVEGQMDALMAHQAGTVNAVAVSGTALTPLHLQHVRRLCEQLIFAFDPDTAGFAASRRGIELAYEAGLEVKIAALPHGKDPADMIASSQEHWQNTLASAKESIAFFLETFSPTNSYEVEPHKKNRAAKELFPLLARMESHMVRAHWLQTIAHHLRAPEESVAEDFKNFLRKKKNDTIQTPLNPPLGKGGSEGVTRHQLLEEKLLGMLLLYPALVPRAALEEKQISAYHTLHGAVLADRLAKGEAYADFPDDLRAQASRLMSALEQSFSPQNDEEITAEYNAITRGLSQEILKEELTGLRLVIAEAERKGAQEEKQKLLEEFSKKITTYGT